jgi:hypothetical protein
MSEIDISNIKLDCITYSLLKKLYRSNDYYTTGPSREILILKGFKLVDCESEEPKDMRKFKINDKGKLFVKLRMNETCKYWIPLIISFALHAVTAAIALAALLKQ